MPIALAFSLGQLQPAWAWMWLLAIAVWFGCKWLSWREAAPIRATLAYFLAWPGMDPRPFLTATKTPPRPTTRQWLRAEITTLCGLVLVWIIARKALPISVLLAGWIGMIGIVIALHFGLFHLIALWWQSRGVAVEPLMNHPLRATSVADFWARWNRGFRDLAYRMIFRPLHRRVGLVGATLATFLFSGLVHDLVISVPTRGGYGLPTLYFLIQGFAVLFEKSPLERRLNPFAKRAFAYLTLIAPIGLLFHSPFVERVCIPFLAAIRAI